MLVLYMHGLVLYYYPLIISRTNSIATSCRRMALRGKVDSILLLTFKQLQKGLMEGPEGWTLSILTLAGLRWLLEGGHLFLRWASPKLYLVPRLLGYMKWHTKWDVGLLLFKY